MGDCLDWVRPQASIPSPTAVKSRPFALLGKSMSVTPSTAQLSTEVQRTLFLGARRKYVCIYVYLQICICTHTKCTYIYIHTLIHTLTHFCVYGCNRDSCLKSLSVSSYQLSLPSFQKG